MKVIALYLPQYHAIEENSLWWGNGYTEWVAVKNAKPLYKGHYQPKIPLKENYYDLSNIKVMEWQAEIARENGIYGFCYWHYWFDGKLLLETPLKNMLYKETPNFPFCFAWANESWTRTWYGQKNNILIKQEYGDKKSWEKHFVYLLKYFTDKRYMLIDKKPIFLLLNSCDIDPCEQLMDYWNDLSIKAGFSGIFFIKILSGRLIDKRPIEFAAQMFFEPGYTVKHGMPLPWRMNRRKNAIIRRYINKIKLPFKYIENILIYDEVYQNIIDRVPRGDIITIPGAFTDWDNSPRRKYSSSVFIGSSPRKFERYLIKLIEKAKYSYKIDMLFINAWNEWGEGAYLEPDEKNENGYLRAVNNAIKKTEPLGEIVQVVAEKNG